MVQSNCPILVHSVHLTVQIEQTRHSRSELLQNKWKTLPVEDSEKQLFKWQRRLETSTTTFEAVQNLQKKKKAIPWRYINVSWEPIARQQIADIFSVRPAQRH